MNYFDSGAFQQLLTRRIAYITESQHPERQAELQHYLQAEIGPQLKALGFTLHRFDNPQPDSPPFLIAVRIKDPAQPTLLYYCHGDVVSGDAENWRQGLSPWQLTTEGELVWPRQRRQHSV